MERKRLGQELTAEGVSIRLSNDAVEPEMSRRVALVHNLEDGRTRE